MNISEKLDRLMELIYDISQDNSTYSPTYGVSAATIIDRYGTNSYAAGAANIDDIRLLIESGWIEIVPTPIPKIRPGLSGASMIKLKPEGITYVENMRQSRMQPWLKRYGPKLVKDLIELIIKFFKP